MLIPIPDAEPIEINDETTVEDTIRAEIKWNCRCSFLYYFKTFSPAKDLKLGRQHLDTAERLQRAYDDFCTGLSSYLLLEWPFRHGKSEMTECFAAWFYGNQVVEDVIMCAYGAELAENELSAKARSIFEKSAWVWGLTPSKTRWALSRWGAEGRQSGITAVGIGGAVTGKGAALLLIDDPYKNRQEAESEVVRVGVRSSFASDLMTRLAPVHIVVALMNRWHVDDLIGWIKKKNDPAHEEYDAEFPVFIEIKYPAQSERWAGVDNPEGWLFPERYPPEWYHTMRATMGGESGYAWSCQGLQEPFARHGNMLKIEGVKIIPVMRPGLRWRRGWDLASTEAERVKDDPDFTVGTKAAIDNSDNSLWIENIKFAQLTADERDDLICETAIADGNQVQVWIEGIAGYVDTFNRVKKRLRSHGIDVRLSNPRKSKEMRAEQLESYFATGHVYMLDAPWNERAKREYGLFPGGEHDDFVDSLVNSVDDAITERQGEPAFKSDSLDKLKIPSPGPNIYRVDSDPPGVYWFGWHGIPHETILKEKPNWKGYLMRGWWLARSTPSAVVWIHVDSEGSWCVFNAMQQGAGESLNQFALRALEGSKNTTGQDYQFLLDQASSDDDEQFLWQLQEDIANNHRVSKSRSHVSLPQWLPPTRLVGKSGLEVLDKLISNSEAGQPENVAVWPEPVISALRSVRAAPQRDQFSTQGERYFSPPLVLALRCLAVDYLPLIQFAREREKVRVQLPGGAPISRRS